MCFLCLELSEAVVTCAAREPVIGPAHSGPLDFSGACSSLGGHCSRGRLSGSGSATW